MMRWLLLSAMAIAGSLSATVSGHAQAFVDANPCSGGLGLPQPVLRQDFTDLAILSCPDPKQDLKPAVGARLSYTYDDMHGASGASLDGLAALNFHYTTDVPRYLPEISFGPYAQGAGTHTFAAGTTPASTSGAVTTGAFAQFFLERPFLTNFELPFLLRIRGGEAFDSTSVRDGTFVGEIIPSFLLSQLFGSAGFENGRDFQFGAERDLFSGLKLIFAPELEVQYDVHQTGPLTYALFASRHQAMRVGPLLVLKLYGFGGLVGVASPFYRALQSTALSLTYHADWDTLSDRRYYSFQPAVIFNLDKTGNYAISTAYSIGDSEASGNRYRQLKVAFSAKF